MFEGDPELARTVILEAVENQLRENNPPATKETLDRLIHAGHSKDEAKDLIAAVLAGELFDVLQSSSGYDEVRYLARLKQLPDMPWKDQ